MPRTRGLVNVAGHAVQRDVADHVRAVAWFVTVLLRWPVPKSRSKSTSLDRCSFDLTTLLKHRTRPSSPARPPLSPWQSTFKTLPDHNKGLKFLAPSSHRIWRSMWQSTFRSRPCGISGRLKGRRVRCPSFPFVCRRSRRARPHWAHQLHRGLRPFL